MKSSYVDESSSLLELLSVVARNAIEQDDARCRIELVRFSGSDEDIIHEEATGHVYLRCRATRQHDEEGVAAELIGRLAAVGGLWTVPNRPCEMVALVAEGTSQIPGAAYLLPLGQQPRKPGKLKRERAYLDLPVDQELAAIAKAVTLMTALRSFIAIDDTGRITISAHDGSHIVIDPAAHQIKIVASDGGDPTQNVLAAIVVDQSGIKMTTGPTGILAHWSSSGSFTQIGAGFCTLAHPQGTLGPVPALPIAYPAGAVPAPSATWRISG